MITRAHPYVDIAHRAALLYSFATPLIAVLVELSAWSTWVNLAAAMTAVFFFVSEIGSYILHGVLRDTTNQFAEEGWFLRMSMVLLTIGEVGGFAVVFAGFVVGQFG